MSAKRFTTARPLVAALHAKRYDSAMEQKPQPLDYAPPPAMPAVKLWHKIFSGIMFITGGLGFIVGMFTSMPAAREDCLLAGWAFILAGVIFRFPNLRIF